MTDTQQREAARQFFYKWNGRGKEDEDARSYWIDILVKIFGVSDVTDYVDFEKKVVSPTGTKNRIDAYIGETRVLIEQKSLGIPLDKPQAGHGGKTPYEQAKEYDNYLAYDERARWIIISNFSEIWIYDMSTQAPEPVKLHLESMQEKYSMLEFLVNKEKQRVSDEMRISLQAGELVGRMYDLFRKQYKNPDRPEAQTSLNKLCVRIVFCLFGEDSGLFGKKSMFHDYMARFDAQHARKALMDLFVVLNQKPEERDPYLPEDNPLLAQFPYVNGGLFADDTIEIPPLTDNIMSLLLRDASDDFDWSGISPTIFGAVFESTLNSETRRAGGMHYTSIENIHKVINPLFLDDLKKELDGILYEEDGVDWEKDPEWIAIVRSESAAQKIKDYNTRSIAMADIQKQIRNYESRKRRKKNTSLNDKRKQLKAYRDKLASLTFLDPACGSGNFLTETYLSLRRLDNEALRQLIALTQTEGQITFVFDGTDDPIKVRISQMYGIEINDFAVTVAKTALWISEYQMLKETEAILHHPIDFLPLKTNAHIVEGNALRMNWGDVVPSENLSYIMGNPPFSAGRRMGSLQRADMDLVAGDFPKNGDLDYVCCWYIVAARYMQGSNIKTGFVSTSSISQGDQVINLWKKLFNEYHLNIFHAVRSFNWQSEASKQAGVHCIIVEFVVGLYDGKKTITTGDDTFPADHINGYLMDTADIWVAGQKKPICDVPLISNGNKPLDNAICAFTPEEKKEFLKKEPAAAQYFRRYMGSREFINNIERWFLLINRIPPHELKKMPSVLELLGRIQEYRRNSDSAQTKKLADTPAKFHFENMPGGNFLVIPQTSSGRRRYVPIGFLTPDVMVNNKLQVMRNGGLYELGILSSNVHNAWLRTVAGRFREDFTYSVSVVYNTFPWPSPTDDQRAKIEKTAQGILDARALYPDSSLADLYDPLTMPPELQKAHSLNDAAVMKAYGMPVKTTTEADCVAWLMRMYQEMVQERE